MSFYRCVVLNQDGTTSDTLIEASDSKEAVAALSNNHPQVLHIKKLLFLKIPRNFLLDFLTYFFCYIKSGFPPSVAMSHIKELLSSPFLIKIINVICEKLSHGYKLSQTLSFFPSLFPKLIVVLFKLSEQTGQLSDVVRHLVDYLKWKQQVENKIKKALRYPSFLLLIICAMVVLLLAYATPPEGLLPAKKESFVIYGIKNNMDLLGLFLLGFIISMFFLKRTNPHLFYKILFILPTFKEYFLLKERVYFIFCFKKLLENGVTLHEAYNHCVDAISNPLLQSKALISKELFLSGATLTEIFKKSNLFSPVTLHLIEVGEKTGNLSYILGTHQEYLQQKWLDFIDNRLQFLEPLLLLCVGALMAFIVLTTFVPMYDQLTTLNW